MEAAHIEGKGLGVVAREEIPEGTVVAYYLCKLQRNHFGDCTYCIAGEGGVRSPVLPPSSRPSRQNPEPTLPTGYPLMDIFEGSFPPAGVDGIPYIASPTSPTKPTRTAAWSSRPCRPRAASCDGARCAPRFDW